MGENQNKSQIILYQTEDGQTRLEVRLENETVWLTHKMMAELFQVAVPTINEHIKNILDERELAPQATIRKFLIVQNKLHFAISGKTAAELISERADASKPNMGLTAWKGVKVRPGDVTIAKNYLNEKELEQLNRIVTMYLDYAEDQARRHRQIFMRDWRKKLDAFLKFNERDILEHAGTVTKEVADALALEHYEVFNKHRLKGEAEAETLADDEAFKMIEQKASKRLPKKKGGENA